jgi:hypothetical protein
MSAQRILNVGLSSEQDVVLVRQRARQVSALLGFSQQDQVRIATAVSEVARGACQLAFGGRAAGRNRHLEALAALAVLLDQENGTPAESQLAGAARHFRHRGRDAHLVLLRKAEQRRDLARALAQQHHVLLT